MAMKKRSDPVIMSGPFRSDPVITLTRNMKLVAVAQDRNSYTEYENILKAMAACHYQEKLDYIEILETLLK